VKLRPRRTGLPMAVWITENDGHKVTVKVSPGLPAADVALVAQWIELNRATIIDFWDGVIDFAEVATRLRPL
jgi:hypothetical protein